MCGRYTYTATFQKLTQLLALSTSGLFQPRYNIAPSQSIPVVRLNPDTGQYESVDLHWGFIPSWANDPRIGKRLINARAETVADKPSFRKAFQERRCLVLADGYYEWKREGKVKQPYYIRFQDRRPFAFAGLWERWENDGRSGWDSCAIITTASSSLMQSIHHRMPVILASDAYSEWLDLKASDIHRSIKSLQGSVAADFEAYPVSRLVNDPRNDYPACLEPLVEI